MKSEAEDKSQFAHLPRSPQPGQATVMPMGQEVEPPHLSQTITQADDGIRSNNRTRSPEVTPTWVLKQFSLGTFFVC
ncbi:hypothetical protein [Noviherbaspirillum galbum]|uniref:Uncharacterized protein n=1 Tax=Noviherbaspirillum galbum TaxID=2709383 RepID=A0A6B3SUQ2_9BURK|nr:hypothetical protein [Noviherbaspirillum galbum]NEX64523.1 hypothetical protein [Noviherbaspirillum galbum]